MMTRSLRGHGFAPWLLAMLVASPAALNVAWAEDRPLDQPPAGADAPAKPDEKEPELEGDELKAHKKRVRELVDQLEDSKNRELVRGLIERMGSSATRAERDALMQFAATNKNHEFVSAAFVALAKMRHPKAIAFLCGDDALRNKNFLVAHSAAEALGTSRNPAAAASILVVMRDRRTKIEVVGACTLAAAKCGPTDEHVIYAVMEYSRHRKDTIRSNALEAVGHLGSDEAVARLTEAIVEDKLARARAAAATGLGWTYRREVIPTLEKAIREDSSLHVQTAASDAIKVITDGKKH